MGLFNPEVCGWLHEPCAEPSGILGSRTISRKHVNSRPFRRQHERPRDRVDSKLVIQFGLLRRIELDADELLAQLDDLRVGECSLLHHAAPATVPPGEVSEDTPV